MQVFLGLFEEYPDQESSRLDPWVVAVLQQRDPLHPAVGEMLFHLLIEPALQLVPHGPVQACPRLGLAGLACPLAELRVGRLLADTGPGPSARPLRGWPRCPR